MTGPPKPEHERHLEAAWPNIDKAVSTALGPPKDRAVRKLVEVRDVSASERVLIVDAEVERGETKDGLTETTYRGKQVGLVHRRHTCSVSTDDLEQLAKSRAKAQDRVKHWAAAVLHAETMRLTSAFREHAAAPVSEPLGVDSLKRARTFLPAGEVMLLLASDAVVPGKDGDETKKALRKALHTEGGGRIVDLPLDQAKLGARALLVSLPRLEDVVVYVAIDFVLGWKPSPDGNGVVLHLDRRTSDMALEAGDEKLCIPIEPFTTSEEPEASQELPASVPTNMS